MDNHGQFVIIFLKNIFIFSFNQNQNFIQKQRS